MIRTARSIFVAGTVLLALATAPARAADDGPCAADAARWCDGTTPKEQLSCLQSHRADLADSCRDYLEYVMVSIEAVLQDCEPDAFQLCRNVGRGLPTMTCLASNSGKLTRRCQEDFDGFVRMERSAAKDCQLDAMRDCPNERAGTGKLAICLLYKGKRLSPACRKALAP